MLASVGVFFASVSLSPLDKEMKGAFNGSLQHLCSNMEMEDGAK
jgi:hypothetical protein